jgi:2Fe-2S ferredoxin
MPKISFIAHDGAEFIVDADNGQSLMQIAVDNGVPSILGDCGGSCACATCHGYIDEQWLARVPAPAQDEQDMLEGALEVKANSRLLCQVFADDKLDGIIVRLPLSQY